MPYGESHAGSAFRTATIGLLGLAAAMGIGRFAFTPLLPLMQQQFGLTLTEGGWLASANYFGYLAGALLSAAAAPEPGRAARWGLLGVALLTVATGLTHSFAAWLLLRFGAGVASAFVLVGIASWALAALACLQRGRLAGVVFAGVGVGIVLAGLVGLATGLANGSPDRAWIALGLMAAAICAVSWPALRPPAPPPSAAVAPVTEGTGATQWRMILCYGAFGFGYIIPATFLPAFARQLIDDAAVFGWVWPAFGLAAAGSTVLSTRLAGHVPAHRVWAYGQLVMAFGVLAPALVPSLATMLFSALCVGSTFMVVTMAGIQHARATSGPAAPRLIAAMTTAFAIGQLVGPLTIRSAASGSSMMWPSVLAACVLLASTAALWRSPAAPVAATVSTHPERT